MGDWRDSIPQSKSWRDNIPAAAANAPASSTAAYTPAPERFLSSLYDQTLGPVVGIVKDYAQHSSDNYEKYGLLGGFPAVAQTISDVGNGINNGVINAGSKTIDAVKRGDWRTAVQQAPGVVPIFGPGTVKAGEQFDQGDYAGMLGTSAGLLGTAAAPEAGARVAPYAKAVAPIAAEGALQVAKKLPVVKDMIGATSTAWDYAVKVQKAIQKVNAGNTADVPASTIKTEIPTKFSADSVTETMGTKPPTAETPGAGLDDATHQRLTDSVATIKALPADAKAALTRAVKAGDDDAVHSILDRHTAVKNVNDAVNNKVAVLVKYAQDHNVDLSTITPDARQSFADAAFAHGVKNGMKVPKSGYRGISDDTMRMVQDGSKQPAVSAQPATTNSATDVKDAFASLAGGGVTEALYAKLFKKLQNGDLTEAGAPSKFLKTVKPVFDSGLIKTPADLSAWAHSGAYKW